MRIPKVAGFFTKRLEMLSQRQLIILAAIISILLAIILYTYLSGTANKVNDVQPVNTAAVIVAKQDIPARTKLDAAMLKVVAVPVDLLPVQPVQDMDSAVGKTTQVPIMAGDIVTVPKLFSDSGAAGFTGMIPPDCRAISVKISDITGVSGFARPGDYVDVVLVSTKSDKDGITGKIILQNVLLLGINKSSGTQDTANKGSGDAAKSMDNAVKEATLIGEV